MSQRLGSTPVTTSRRIGSASRSTCVRAAAAGKQQQQRVVRAAAAQQQDEVAQHLDAPTFWARAFMMQAQQQHSSSTTTTTVTTSSSKPIFSSTNSTAACTVAALGGALLALMPAEAAHAAAHGADVPAQLAAAANPSFDLAEGEEFWGNVAQYGRYFVTVMLGTGYVMVKPVLGLFRNPLTGSLAVVGIVGLAYGLKVTLDAMLGISDPVPYLPLESVGF